MSLICTVVSFVPLLINEEKPGLIPPRFTIPPSDGKIPQLLYVETATHFVYLDEARGFLQVKNPPDVIARAIVQDYIKGQLGTDDNSSPALFWKEGRLEASDVFKKYPEEVKEHLERQRHWFMNLTKIADDDWQRYHRHNAISDFQRRIAEFINLDPREHEWMSPLSIINEINKFCPWCKSSIDKEAAICPECGKICDIKRYKELEAEHAKA